MKMSYVMMFLMMVSCALIVSFTQPNDLKSNLWFLVPITFAIIAFIFVRRDARKERELEKERGRYWRWH